MNKVHLLNCIHLDPGKQNQNDVAGLFLGIYRIDGMPHIPAIGQQFFFCIMPKNTNLSNSLYNIKNSYKLIEN